MAAILHTRAAIGCRDWPKLVVPRYPSSQVATGGGGQAHRSLHLLGGIPAFSPIQSGLTTSRPDPLLLLACVGICIVQ